MQLFNIYFQLFLSPYNTHKAMRAYDIGGIEIIGKSDKAMLATPEPRLTLLLFKKLVESIQPI
jgi:hypothetical protein